MPLQCTVPTPMSCDLVTKVAFCHLSAAPSASFLTTFSGQGFPLDSVYLCRRRTGACADDSINRGRRRARAWSPLRRTREGVCRHAVSALSRRRSAFVGAGSASSAGMYCGFQLPGGRGAPGSQRSLPRALPCSLWLSDLRGTGGNCGYHNTPARAATGCPWRLATRLQMLYLGASKMVVWPLAFLGFLSFLFSIALSLRETAIS